MSDHHAQCLIMGNQCSPFEPDSANQMFRDFQDSENNKNMISAQIENAGWVTDLRLSRNDANLSYEVFLKKVPLGTPPKSLRQVEKPIEQTMAN